MEISGMTQVLGLFGDPVLYSLSPAMHNAACSYLQLPYVYIPFRVEKNDLPAAVAAIRALNIKGVNITVPHKEAVIPFLDQLDESARRCGAVNTIINNDGVLTGYNTDGVGFIDSLREADFNPAGKKAVILGAGGAARAVGSALVDSGVKEILIINRTVAKAERLARLLDQHVRFQQLILGSTLELADIDIIINTLSIPFKEQGEWLLNFTSAQRTLFYDLRYGQMPSDFLTFAKTINAPALDGLGMLLHQGARAFSLFTGKEAPLAVMRSALAL
ncbi:MAG: shikimate dehydrogenase [Firmicutes bacterium]|nr:shikimate dehydrogenase [Bacillota bacterium]